MNIEVNAEGVKLWVNEHKRNDGSVWRSFSTTVSSKDKETGEYINKPLKVRMTRNITLPEDLQNGRTVSIKGSLSTERFTDKEGQDRIELLLWAHEIAFDFVKPTPKGDPADSFSAAEDDIPF